MLLSCNLPFLSLPDLDVSLNKRAPVETGKHKVSGVGTSSSAFCSRWHKFRPGSSALLAVLEFPCSVITFGLLGACASLSEGPT